jgi:hypothetical protein
MRGTTPYLHQTVGIFEDYLRMLGHLLCSYTVWSLLGVKVFSARSAHEGTRLCETDVAGKGVPVRQLPPEYDFSLTVYSTVVTICTAFFNITKSLRSARTALTAVCLCVSTEPVA